MAMKCFSMFFESGSSLSDTISDADRGLVLRSDIWILIVPIHFLIDCCLFQWHMIYSQLSLLQGYKRQRRRVSGVWARLEANLAEGQLVSHDCVLEGDSWAVSVVGTRWKNARREERKDGRKDWLFFLCLQPLCPKNHKGDWQGHWADEESEGGYSPGTGPV